MWKALKILICQEDSTRLQTTSSNKSHAPNGDTYSRATCLNQIPVTNGISTLKQSLTIFYKTHPTHYGTGHLQTVCLQEKLCSHSLNIQDLYI